MQKSDNLQIWNEEIVPTRRYVVVRDDEHSIVTAVRVVTGEHLARLDTTGTLTRKYQAKSRTPVIASQLVTRSDAYGLVERVQSLGKETVFGTKVDFVRFLPIARLFAELVKLVGTRMPDPGADQERNRGGALHESVCRTLGMAEKRDTGTCPDVLEQLLEIKLQTSPTIDLGLVSPDDETPLEAVPFAKHGDVRYAVFYGDTKVLNLGHEWLRTALIQKANRRPVGEFWRRHGTEFSTRRRSGS